MVTRWPLNTRSPEIDITFPVNKSSSQFLGILLLTILRLSCERSTKWEKKNIICVKAYKIGYKKCLLLSLHFQQKPAEI